MAKRKKRKLKKGCLLFLVIILIGFFSYGLIKNFVGFEIKNIYVSNNNLFSDDYIIELANLKQHPNFYTTTISSIKKNIKKSNYIKDATVKKKFFQSIDIYVEEYDILFLNNENNTFILENKKQVEKEKDIVNIPILINYVPDQKFDILVEKFLKIDINVRNKISEIKYDPNDLDEDRFLLYMNDENYVYITLTKFDSLNKYNEAIEKFEGKKGILYLDSGNYFEIKK